MFLIILISSILVVETPRLNKEVIRYVDSVIGTRVDRGECWDLAAAALDHAGAYHDLSSQKTIYVFGEEVNPSRQQVFAGDIVQIENMKLEYTKDNMIFTETMKHHTAIIYRVLSEGKYEIAHQNTSFSGRKVGVSELDMNTVKSGKIIFYRPLPK